MFIETKIKKKVKIDGLLTIIQKYDKQDIECTTHTFFRLSKKQRKIYTCNELKRILKQDKPFLVGLQYNENYALFYKYHSKNLKIIVDMNNRKIKIVTFYFIQQWQIPNI